MGFCVSRITLLILRGEVRGLQYIELLIYDAEDAELGDIIRAKIYIDDNDSATVKFSSSSYTVAEEAKEDM